MKNKKSASTFLASILLIAAGLGCGSLGGDKIENDVINEDFRDLELPVTGGTSKKWLFGADQGRCFSVVESKFSGDNAQLTVGVASYYESDLEVLPGTFTVFGTVIMNYKRVRKDWVLQKAEGIDLVEKRVALDEFNKFLDIAAPLCRNYRAKF